MTNIDLIKSFNQGPTGNCVSIAIIKAAIEIFALDNVFFRTPNSVDQGFSFLMKDGFEEQVTQQELDVAIAGSRFELQENQTVLNYANICFAAMAKRAMIEGNDDMTNLTYQQAIDTLNNGEYYLHGPNWLGLRHNFRYVGRKFVRNNPGCVGASRYHCFYVSYGWKDEYGNPDKIGLFENHLAHWFRITKEQVF